MAWSSMSGLSSFAAPPCETHCVSIQREQESVRGLSDAHVAERKRVLLVLLSLSKYGPF